MLYVIVSIFFAKLVPLFCNTCMRKYIRQQQVNNFICGWLTEEGGNEHVTEKSMHNRKKR